MAFYYIPLKSENLSPSLAYFKPTKILTNVEAPGLVMVENIYINDSAQLLVSVDAWLWSARYVEQIQQAFLDEHGLAGRSSEEIDEYLAEQEMSLPTPNAILLPTLSKRDKVRAELKGECTIMLIGVGH